MPYITIADDLTFHYVIPTSKDPLHPTLDPGKETLLLLHPRMFDLQVLEPQFACARLKKYNLVRSCGRDLRVNFRMEYLSKHL
jgi:hypothetical protein